MLYKTLALISPYNSHLENLVSEIRRLKHLFDTKLVLISFNEQLKGKNTIQETLEKWDLAPETEEVKVFYLATPSIQKIIDIFKEEKVDLVVSHAFSQKSSVLDSLNYFAKSLFINEITFNRYINLISKKIIKRLDTSLLLLHNPSITPKPIEKIVVSDGNLKSGKTLAHAMHFAKYEKAKDITIFKQANLARLHSLMTDSHLEQEVTSEEELIAEQETNQVHTILAPFDTEGMNIAIKVIKGQLAYEMAQFSIQNEVDLLVTNLSDYNTNLIDRILGNHLEYLLSNLPCNLLLVHHR